MTRAEENPEPSDVPCTEGTINLWLGLNSDYDPIQNQMGWNHHKRSTSTKELGLEVQPQRDRPTLSYEWGVFVAHMWYTECKALRGLDRCVFLDSALVKTMLKFGKIWSHVTEN